MSTNTGADYFALWPFISTELAFVPNQSNRRIPCPKPSSAVCSEVKLLKYNLRITYQLVFPLVDCTVGVASPGQARQAQISRFLLVLGTEDVLALSKDTIGTTWASHIFFSKKYYSNDFFEFTLTDFVGELFFLNFQKKGCGKERAWRKESVC